MTALLSSALRGARLDETPCRLCAGPAAFAFKNRVIGRYDVSYFRCSQCGSLQTEEPFWLSEAYADPELAIDTGAVQRVLQCVGVTHAVAKIFGYRKMLDFGGGSGLFCRLLRDCGYDAYNADAYSPPGYAAGFSGSLSEDYDLITAFEVVEHFANPRTDFGALFARKPAALLIMTSLYQGEREDWWYLAPEEGQHVFFYTRAALERIAAEHGYHLHFVSSLALFLRSTPTFRQRLLLRLLRRRVVALIKLIALSGPTRAPQADYDRLVERAKQRAARQEKPAG